MIKLKRKTIPQILLSAKLGDGSYAKCPTNINYCFRFTSYKLDYISHVKSQIDKLGYYTGNLATTKSGFKKGSFGYTFSTRVHPYFTKIALMSISEALDLITKLGLCYLFLDDGSLHKHKFFGHIYCNSFNDAEVEKLIEVMYKYYPQKKCSKRIDKKKDGRKYPYIYIPVQVMNVFKEDVKKLIDKYELHSFDYKVVSPSQTIERQD